MARNLGCPLGSPQTDLVLSSVDIASVSTWRTQQVYWKINDMKGLIRNKAS